MNKDLPRSIVFILPDLGGGGAQRVMLTVAGALDPERFKVHILVAGGSQAMEPALPAGIATTIGRHNRLRSSLPWLVGQLRTLRPDVCVSVMGYVNLALLAARAFLPARTRLIVREANGVEATARALPDLPGKIVSAESLYRRLYPLADAIVAPSTQIVAELASLLPTAARVEHMPSPVDVVGLRQRAYPVRRKPGAGLRLICVGRLTHQKGLDRLLPLFQRLPADSQLKVLGEGQERPALEAQISALGLSGRVAMPGFLPDPAGWIAGADALLLPSRWEGLPNTALEALALGTPVLATPEACLQDVEALSPQGALMVRQMREPFADAMQALASGLKGAVDGAVRDCLLPQAYTLPTVAARWDELFERLSG